MPRGDRPCSDGSQFRFVREANPDKVVFFFQDGGAWFAAETCADGDLDNSALAEVPPAEAFDFATTEYAPGLTIQHKASVNGTAAPDHPAATLPDPTDLVVVGENAGLTVEQRSLPGLFDQSGRHEPEIVFARHEHSYDGRQEPGTRLWAYLWEICCRATTPTRPRSRAPL